mmetsp:Transcript_18166/g.23429  ORF Transcript_18166/g.23429 Transcript_18166/m.23429 type:complete len:173 (-) Transcript_18166:217-735(-)|eukprot:CAMPEP_0198145506 /NCGR_PEP_ID=MMETSP1443-20131203/23987_1 /TAXON_ID=186043 /ORGANISM="Entomoneis sp., Strain CCMP2396" /LENGTH=172 /DNA_ID=CAMNT_0043809183 /DNA_START=81 /DNA_END=599 /DNA_ORIENTATION=+
MASFGLGRSGPTAAIGGQQAQGAIDSSTPWVAAADGNLALLQSSLQTLQLPITAADENSYTLLQAAASYSHLPILEWLMANCTDMEAMMGAVDNEGDSALHYVSTKEAAQFLIHHGADPTIRNAEGKTALESKQEELEESMQDQEDGEEDDEELMNLKGIHEYLMSLQSQPQ